MKRIILSILGVAIGVILSLGAFHVGQQMASADTGPAALLDAGVSLDAGTAPATAPVLSADDPGGAALQLYDFVRSGKALPAVGAGLMLFVWGIRKLLPGSWSKSKIGGYAIGFGSAFLLFVGTALAAGAPVTLGLILQALGTGAAASGIWEKIKDLLAATGAKPPLTPAT